MYPTPINEEKASLLPQPKAKQAKRKIKKIDDRQKKHAGLDHPTILPPHGSKHPILGES